MEGKSFVFLNRALLILALGQGEAFAGQEPIMRVLVKEVPKTRIRADSESPLFVKGLGPGVRRLRALILTQEKGKLNIKMDGYSNSKSLFAISDELVIRSKDPRGIWVDKRRYRGVLNVGVNKGVLQVVNHIPIESYLVSVVGSEMPKSWPRAALKAQAIAARTYALKQIGKAGNYDVKSTNASQVYMGVESETKTTRAAVKSTHTLVLVNGGKLIDAVFHSSAGGRTEASGDVWAKQVSYLQSVVDHDQHSPWYKWKMRFEPQQLRVLFKEIGGIRNIKIQSKSKTGRILLANIRGPLGEVTLSGKDLRHRLGLRSTLVAFKMLPTQVDPYEFPVDTNNVKLPPIVTSQGKLPGLKPLPLLLKKTGRQTPLYSVSPLPPLPKKSRKQSNFRKDAINQYAMLATGFGSGHGVGMSQWGAHGLAKKGASFSKILNYYYQRVEIVPYKRLMKR